MHGIPFKSSSNHCFKPTTFFQSPWAFYNPSRKAYFNSLEPLPFNPLTLLLNPQPLFFNPPTFFSTPSTHFLTPFFQPPQPIFKPFPKCFVFNSLEPLPFSHLALFLNRQPLFLNPEPLFFNPQPFLNPRPATHFLTLPPKKHIH